MMTSRTPADEAARYLDALDAIPCAQLDHDGWVRVGMACKAAGLPVEAWDEWSATDPDRYEFGECERRWQTFDNEPNGITAATLVFLARQHGWDGPTDGRMRAATAKASHAADMPAPTLDLDRLGRETPAPLDLSPDEQLREYARHVFAADDVINVVLDADRDGRPRGWGLALTQAELVEHAAEIVAKADTEHGAWVRINPVCDGERLSESQQDRVANGLRARAGYCDEHVTAYRNALIECDPDADALTADELEADKERQLDLMLRLHLPCAAIVDSGHKSIHAIVRVDAADADEYRGRVRWLHTVCRANGLDTDPQDKNPSRLSRLPGAVRGGGVQKLVGVDVGFSSFAEWRQWVEAEARPVAQTDAQDEGGKPGRGQAKRHQPTQAELVALMRTDPDVMGSFGTNVLDGGLYVTGPLPWDMLGERRRWQDADAEHLFMYVQGIAAGASRRNVAGAFTVLAAENRFNPIAEMLDSLPAWDGVARADCLLWVLFGCEDNEYTRAVSRTFMRGAVLRAYQPGSKFDYTLVLIGPQGCGKSRGVARMAMRPEFLCESVSDLTDHKLTCEQTMGRWIVELAELEGMTGRRLTAVKQALTMTSATVRLAYARNPIDLPRSCVFAATTNEAEFLADPTGARRFLPVRCAVADREGWRDATERDLEGFVMLAWAEIVAEYKYALTLPSERFPEAFPVWLTPDMEHAADKARESATIEDTDESAVQEWLNRTGETRVCARQVAELALGIDMGRAQSRRVTANVARILNTRCPGWQYVGKQRVPGYGTCRAWDRVRYATDE